MSFDWLHHLRETLDSTYYLSLATHGADGDGGHGGVWVNPVYFAWDEAFNLYFISMPASRHMRYIGDGAPVAVAVYATDQPPGGDVRGIQLSGWAAPLADSEVPEACKIYYGRAGAAEALGGEEPDASSHMGDAATWKFVKIVPVEMYYFDTRYFDEVKQGRQLVPLEQLRAQFVT